MKSSFKQNLLMVFISLSVHIHLTRKEGCVRARMCACVFVHEYVRVDVCVSVCECVCTCAFCAPSLVMPPCVERQGLPPGW